MIFLLSLCFYVQNYGISVKKNKKSSAGVQIPNNQAILISHISSDSSHSLPASDFAKVT